MPKTQNITISNEMSKIFICNTTSDSRCEENAKKGGINSDATSSITILTPDLQIQINNSSFKDSQLKSSNGGANNEKVEVKKHSFNVDEEVFMECEGKFYLGTVINSKADDYLIKFDDNTEKWSNQCKLKKLTASPVKNGTDSLCVICKITNEYDVVEICDKCSRGFHRQCIKQHNSNASPRWNCTRCSYDVISISDSEDLESISAVSAVDETMPVVQENQSNQTKLSYNLQSLKWDTAHRTNKENIYCYCGLTGVWKDKMFQCCRCRQWFHEKCCKSWNGNLLLHGDTFFLFCCSICNDGNEFIRRVHITMRDIIHLVLYELTVTRGQRFHSISRDVTPFIWQNWDKLMLPTEFTKFKTSKVSLEKKILQIVKTKLDDLFKCVIGTKKKGSLYGLRKKVPPIYYHLQKIRIPPSGPFTDDLLGKMKVRIVEPNAVSEEMPKEVEDAKRSLDFEICDSSDDTSSKSTLDLIIPRPDNFKGFNNPFHSNYRSDVKMSEKMSEFVRRSGGGGANLNGNKFPEVRIVRTIKRRLSAKDILQGPNQDSKRRKFHKRRKSADVEVISEIIQPINMPLPQYIPVRTESNSNFSRHSMPMPFGLKSRSERTSTTISAQPVTTASSIKMDSVINSPKKSISLYFGAKNRIENGEKFTIMAKRITFDGKEQYLLEWENQNNKSSANVQQNES